MRGVAEVKEPCSLPMLSVDMENKENGSVGVKNSMENGRPPDPADWAVMDVVNYFRTAGFEEQASAFQEQILGRTSEMGLASSELSPGASPFSTDDLILAPATLGSKKGTNFPKAFHSEILQGRNEHHLATALSLPTREPEK
ncbi:sterile alpha motif domain-containing protein 13 isoform X2 [Lemur catta]|uniref:sterile alpha motif domain-containing protein 13 isoform X2 n=1 Tax=Lemur catta TaxID=9447 RepID=UPI001E26C5DA|nr:sterile alpha motif domain-containing protein 13 isoform X2 [Lemur catta]